MTSSILSSSQGREVAFFDDEFTPRNDLFRREGGYAPPQAITPIPADLVGRVIETEVIHDEPPSFDGCRFATRLIWLLVLLASPVLMVYAVLKYLGALPALLAFIGFFVLLRFLSPLNLLSSVHLLQLLNPCRSQSRTGVPVRHLRVRELNTESERMIQMKGVLRPGNILRDDMVSLTGRWRHGVLQATRCYNHRTQSWIEVQQSHSWVGLLATLLVVTMIFIVFYEPVATLWVKLHSFR